MIPNVLSVNQILFYLKVVVLRIIAKKNSMMLKHSNVLNAKPNIIQTKISNVKNAQKFRIVQNVQKKINVKNVIMNFI